MKSQIMYRAKLSFRQLEIFLSLCMTKELLKVKIEGSRVVYATTEKGVRFLEAYEDFVKRVKELDVLPIYGAKGGATDES